MLKAPPATTGAAALRRDTLLVALAAAVLIILLAWPVLQRPHERIFGNEIVGRHGDAYWAIGQIHQPRLYHRTQPVTDWPPAALARLVGAVPAFNAVILTSFPLAAAATFLLASYLGLARLPAAGASIFFTFSAFHLSHAAYHPHITQLQWLPLYLLALWACLDHWKPSRALALLAAAGLVALSNFYAGYFAAALTPVALVAYWWFSPRHEKRPVGGLWRTAATLAGATALGSTWVLLLVPEVLERYSQLAWPRTDLFLYGARWWSYLIPPVEHPLFGSWALARWTGEDIRDGLLEQQLSLGLSLLVLAAVAVWGWARGERDSTAQRAVPVLAAVAAAALLFSLPAGARDGTLFFRPSALLYLAAPMFRAHARFGAFFQLMVVLLAGIGFYRLRHASGRAPTIAAWVLAAIAVVENVPYPPARWHDVLPTTAHRWLASQPEAWKLLDCKSKTEQDTVRYLMPQTTRLLGDDGFSDCGGPLLAGRLATHGFTHLLVRGDSTRGARLEAEGPPAGFETAHHRDDGTVLRITADPLRHYLRPGQGFSWREYNDEGSYRWMAEEGEIEMVNATETATSVVVHLRLQAYARERPLHITLDGESVAHIVVPASIGDFDIGPIALPAGGASLKLLSTDGADSPAELGAGRDRRKLSVALWHWGVSPADAGL
jgi:hypothetical protein